MNEKYSSYIELTPGYESVVNLTSDNDASFWSRYIVNDDMVTAVDLLAKSLRPDDPNEDVWHYWLKGAYGTGKTYSAIVLKHLLMDDYSVVEEFLNRNPLFIDVKAKFLASRKKAKHLVAFRSGECKQLNTSNKFLFEIEQTVRVLLKEHSLTYMGANSLLDSVCATVTKFRSTLAEAFDNGDFPEYWASYDEFDDFYEEVQRKESVSCSAAQEILLAMNVGLATDLESLKVWLKDVFQGNPQLNETNSGIFIIWDEFTEYIRENDLDIIQQLSLLSKEIPFFMIYVLHEYPGIFDQNVVAGMGKADARFHKIDITISEKTTLKLIGESIVPVEGKAQEWEEICDTLQSSLLSHISELIGDPDSDMDQKILKKIFPIHPMTVNLVSKVAGLAASNRSIFEFLKSSSKDGFRTYIQEHGLDDWKWVSIDYLWDYYFVNNHGGKKDFTEMTEDALKHYVKSESRINDANALRVFKGAMLLLATIGTGNRLRGRARRGTIQATEKTLCLCFAGSMEADEVKQYLAVLGPDQLKLLVLAEDAEEGCRIELPYSGTGDELNEEIKKASNKFTETVIFQHEQEDSFGHTLVRQFFPSDKASLKRLEAVTCWGTVQQIKHRFLLLKNHIEKTPHKFGILIVANDSIETIEGCKKIIKEICKEHGSNRLMVALLATPFSKKELNSWYNYLATGSMAQKSGNSVNASHNKAQADELRETWVTTSLAKPIYFFTEDNTTQAFSSKNILKLYDDQLKSVFPYAPEHILRLNTLYKAPTLNASYFALTRLTDKTKEAGNDKQKSFNAQWQGCVDVLSNSEADLFSCTTIQEVQAITSSKVAIAISELCTIVEEECSSGTVILNKLWKKLQEQLGYYEVAACSYLLGFVFRFYLGKFTWHDGQNGNKLDEESAARMIQLMLTGKSTGMKLSSESDIEKRMKALSGDIFGLSKDKLGDIFECQKYIKVEISTKGYPLWAAKYLSDEHYQEKKVEICEIIDKLQSFILAEAGQSVVVESIVTQIKKQAKVYVPILKSLFANSEELANGLETFLYQEAPYSQEMCNKYKFSQKHVILMLSKMLEAEKWQWREKEVAETAQKLAYDLELVGIMNEAMEESCESVEKLRELLSKEFSNMVIPSSVYESSSFDWKESIQALWQISGGKWLNYSIAEKQAVLSQLSQQGKEGILQIRFPMQVLKNFISSHGLGNFSEMEYQEILQSLPKEGFLKSEASFLEHIRFKIEGLAYSKKIRTVLEIWEAKTKTTDVYSWCATHKMALEWLMPSFDEIFKTVSRLSNKEQVGADELERTLSTIVSMDFTALSNQEEMDRCFIANVASEKYETLLIPHLTKLKDKIIGSGLSDCSKWHISVKMIRDITEKFISSDLKEEVSDQAKEKTKNMSEDEVRLQLSKLLESSTEACLIILNK